MSTKMTSSIRRHSDHFEPQDTDPHEQRRLRGQLELGMRSTSWQLEGQAHGGVPDAVLWDGPFATDGEWRRWPQARAEARLRVGFVAPDGRPRRMPAPWRAAFATILVEGSQ